MSFIYSNIKRLQAGDIKLIVSLISLIWYQIQEYHCKGKYALKYNVGKDFNKNMLQLESSRITLQLR